MLAVLAHPVGAHADPVTWPLLSATVFHAVAHHADVPNPMLPLAMAEDAAGFLWTGGETGVQRWDGYQFRAYVADGADGAEPDGLRDHNVLALHRDSRGRLWVGTGAGGLARYDPAQDRFIPVPLDDGPGAPSVSAIEDDGQGGLWVASATGLYHLDAGGQPRAHMVHEPGRADSLPDDHLGSVLQDRAGVLWVGGRSGLVRSSGADGHFTAVPLDDPDHRTPDIAHLMEDRAGRIWAGSRQDGAFVIAAGRSEGMAVSRIVLDGDATETEIMAMAEIAPGRIWLATFGHGIVDVDGTTLVQRGIFRDLLVPGSLDSDSVYALHVDAAGLVWVATTQGLSLYNPDNDAIRTIFGRQGSEAGAFGAEITGLLERPDGTIWVGSEVDGIAILDPSGRRVRTLHLQRVYDMAAMPDGVVMVASRSGLFQVDAVGEKVTKLTVPGRRDTAGILSLAAIGDAVWLGGLDDGVWCYHPAANGHDATASHLDAPWLANAMVHTLALGPGGTLAIGTENGFSLLNLRSGAMERFLGDPADPAALNSGAVASFAIDGHGRLWVGTDNTGISVLTGRNAAGKPVFARIGIRAGLPNADVNRMQVDRTGRIWASTDNGLATIDPETFEVHALRSAEGVAIATYWSTSGTATSQGDLMFGGVGGVTIVRPPSVRLWTYQPPVVVTGVRVGGVAVPGAGALGGPRVEVTPAANSLAVEFAALDFSAPDRNRYRYRLAGYDPHWTEADAAHRTATFTNLPPGKYTLELAGSNRDGVWSQPVTLPVRVLPARYQTAWARVAAGATASAAIAAIIQLRTMVLRRRQHELERQVAERTSELLASQQELRQFAYFDTLTALPNRRAFNEQFRTLIEKARSKDGAFALALIDLDGFKRVNDTLGHDAGDALLVIAAGRMREALREDDFVARLGGDEFAILLGALRDESRADAICARLVTDMAVPMLLAGTRVTIGASVGVAMYPLHGQTQDELYKHVDLALYEAKRAGKGVWRWYHDLLLTAAAPPVPVRR